MSKVKEPFAGYADFDDCVAKNSDKGDPKAYCAVIKRQVEGEKLREATTANVCGTCNWVQDDPKEPTETCPLCGAKAYYVPVLHPKESFKHADFQKIQTQFITQCGEEEGLRRYQEWIDRLGLDESKSYMSNASMREKFQWIQRHADFQLWKEDVEAKYWRVEAGFPLESMNENVYTKEELIRAARTIKGKTINLNHKFSLPTIEILAGEYETDTVECVIRVPNSLHCPVCDKDKTINNLIESGGIVNVSLEAACDYGTGPHGECEGMNFTGLSLLTKDVLPGIPLTRLMPLESIMVEALQVNETTKGGKKVKTIKMKIVESNQPKEAEYPWDQCIADQTGAGYTEDQAKRICAAIKNRTVTHAMLYNNLNQKEAIQHVLKKCEEDKLFAYELDKFIKEQGTAFGSSATPDDSGENVSHADREGTRSLKGTMQHPETQTVMGTPVVPDKTRTEDVLDSEQPKAGEQPPITGTDKLPPAPAAGEQPSTTGTPAEPHTPMKPADSAKLEPASPHECPDGHHYDYDANQCVPDETIVEQVKRWQAEDKANKLEQNLQLSTKTWEKRCTDLATENLKLQGQTMNYHKQIIDLKTETEKINEQRNNAVVDLRELKINYATLDNLQKKTQLLNEQLQNDKTELHRKYQSTLSTNLDLSRKLTQANEDYLTVAQDKDRAEEALKRSQIQAKKIIRIHP